MISASSALSNSREMRRPRSNANTRLLEEGLWMIFSSVRLHGSIGPTESGVRLRLLLTMFPVGSDEYYISPRILKLKDLNRLLPSFGSGGTTIRIGSIRKGMNLPLRP